MSEPRGAGMAGGLLFVVVVLFLGFLAIQAVIGIVRWVVGLLVLAAVVSLALRVVNRR